MRILLVLAALLLCAVPTAAQRHLFLAASSGYQFRPELGLPVSATLGVGGRYWRGVAAGDLVFPQDACSCWTDTDDVSACRRSGRRRCDLRLERAARFEALLLAGGRVGLGGGYRKAPRSGFYGTLELETPSAVVGGSSLWAKASAGAHLVQFDFGVAARVAF
jgi:hypothetical protein